MLNSPIGGKFYFTPQVAASQGGLEGGLAKGFATTVPVKVDPGHSFTSVEVKNSLTSVASWRCCTRLLPTRWLQIAPILGVVVVEAGSSESRCGQGGFLWEARRESLPAASRLPVAAAPLGVLGLQTRPSLLRLHVVSLR